MINIETKNNSSKISASSNSSFSSARNKPKYNADSINRSVEKAIRNDHFINNALKLLKGMQFPAFKKDIVNYTKDATTGDSDVVSLFESLDGYIEFRDLYHVQKALEENLQQKKTRYQISDKTREHPNVRTRDTTTTAGSSRSKTKSIKELKAVTENEERKDYPEVTPTAMRDFICSKCGKSFQNQDDLVHHRNFERGHKVRERE
jgi:hypothetical protein